MCVFVFDFHTLGGRASIELVRAKGQRTVIDLYGVFTHQGWGDHHGDSEVGGVITVSRSQSLPDIGIFHHETIRHCGVGNGRHHCRIVALFFLLGKKGGRKFVAHGQDSNGKKWCHHKVWEG